LVDSERDETSVSKIKRIRVRMFKKLKEDIQKQLNESQKNFKNPENTGTSK
jgi:hypothetical protein